MKKIINKILLVLLVSGTGSAFAATPLVDVEWIKKHSCDENVRVLDVRSAIDGSSRGDYIKGHIPCAVYSDYMKKGSWRVKANKIPGQLPPVNKITALIGKLGIDNNTHVVIYHLGKKALDLGSATRIYWTFKVLGHDKVSILNGGFLAYAKNKKNKLEKGNNKPKAKTFKANLRKELIATVADVQGAIKNPDLTLVDLRPNHQYIGINRHGKSKRNGTIPSAKSLPESWITVNGGGKFRNKAQLTNLYKLAKLSTTGDKITFCNSGHWASVGWFAESEIMGNKSTKLYDGSMIEWSGKKDLPMDKKVNF